MEESVDNGDGGTTFKSTIGPLEPPSHAVVRSVATVEGVDPLDLDSTLYEVVDPDALDSLLDHVAGGGASPVVVSVVLGGYEVRVASDRSITIHPVRAEPPEE